MKFLTLFIITLLCLSVRAEEPNHSVGATNRGRPTGAPLPDYLDSEQRELIRLLDLAVDHGLDVPVSEYTNYTLVDQYKIDEAIKAIRPKHVEQNSITSSRVISAAVLRDIFLKSVREASRGHRDSPKVVIADCPSNVIRDTIERLSKDYKFFADRLRLPGFGYLNPKYQGKVSELQLGAEISKLYVNPDPKIKNRSFDILSHWLTPFAFQTLIGAIPEGEEINKTRWQTALKKAEWKQLPADYLNPLADQLHAAGNPEARAVQAQVNHDAGLPETQFAMHRLGMDPQEAFSFVNDRDHDPKTLACVLSRFKPDELEALSKQIGHVINSGKMVGDTLRQYQDLENTALRIIKTNQKLGKEPVSLAELLAYRKHFSAREEVEEIEKKVAKDRNATESDKRGRRHALAVEHILETLDKTLHHTPIYGPEIDAMKQNPDFLALTNGCGLPEEYAYWILSEKKLADPFVMAEVFSQFSYEQLEKIGSGEMISEAGPDFRFLAKGIGVVRNANGVKGISIDNLRLAAQYHYLRQPYEKLTRMAAQNLTKDADGNVAVKSPAVRDKIRADFLQASGNTLEPIKELLAAGDAGGAAALLANLADRQADGDLLLFLNVPKTTKKPARVVAFNLGKNERGFTKAVQALDESKLANEALHGGSLSGLSLAAGNATIVDFLKPVSFGANSGLRLNRSRATESKTETIKPYRNASDPILTPNWLPGGTVAFGPKRMSNPFPRQISLGQLRVPANISQPLEFLLGLQSGGAIPLEQFPECYRRWDRIETLRAFPSHLISGTEP